MKKNRDKSKRLIILFLITIVLASITIIVNKEKLKLILNVGSSKVVDVDEKNILGNHLKHGKINTITGTEGEGDSGDYEEATKAKINKPRGIYIDKSDNTYIVDTRNHKIRMIPKKDGVQFGINMQKNNIYTVAGNGATEENGIGGYSGDYSKAIDAQLNLPEEVVLDDEGNLLIADTWNGSVRKVDNEGIITTIAGTGKLASEFSEIENKAIETTFGRVNSIGLDNSNNIYIGEEVSFGEGVVRQLNITTGHITTITKSAKVEDRSNISYGDGRKLTDVRLGNIKKIIFDKEDNMYLSEGSVVHMVPNKDGIYFNIPMKSGNIYYVVGRYDASVYQGDGVTSIGVKMSGNLSMTLDNLGNLCVSEREAKKVHFIDRNSGLISTVAGTGIDGEAPKDGQLAKNSKFNLIEDISMNSEGNLYLCDSGDSSIYSIESNELLDIPPQLIQDFNKNTIGTAVEFSFKDDEKWRKSIFEVIINDENIKKRYTLNKGKIVIKKNVFETSGTYIIRIKSKGYEDAFIVKKINETAKILMADNVNNKVGHKLEITFEDDKDWRNSVIGYHQIHGVYINEERVGKYFLDPGKLTLDDTIITKPGTYTIKISSLGYDDSVVTQKVLPREKPADVEVTLGDLELLAGIGEEGYSGDGGPATKAKLAVEKVHVDKSGNIFISDTTNQRIRMVPKSDGVFYGVKMTKGNIYTVAGDGTKSSTGFGGEYGGDGGKATEAQLSNPRNVVTDKDGNLYIADYANHIIRRVDTGGIITTIVGTKGKISGREEGEGLQGDGGQAKDALIRSVFDMYIDNLTDTLYFTQMLRVRQVDLKTGVITTVTGAKGGIGHTVGTREAIGDGGSAEDAEFTVVHAMTYDKDKNLYIVDNHQIRMIPNESGTYFGTKMTGGNIYTISGHYLISDNFGDGYSARNARFNQPSDIEIDSRGNIYIADSENKAIRFISKESGDIHTIVGEKLDEVGIIRGLSIDGYDNLYFADSTNNKIYRTKIIQKSKVE